MGIFGDGYTDTFSAPLAITTEGAKFNRSSPKDLSFFIPPALNRDLMLMSRPI